MWTLLSDPNFQWVLTASLLLGGSSGTIGAFALLRGRSLLGDVLAHAALPGICLAFTLTGSKDVLPLLLGAALAGIAATKAIDGITRASRVKEDTALGIVLTVFFGFGIVLLTYVQHSGAGNQAGLDSFLFGQTAALVGRDVTVMAIAASILLACVALFFKELKLLCFDRDFGTGMGLPMKVVDTLLMTLVVTAVVIGLQAVGVILMAALLVTPAVSARYWTERLGVMVVLSALFGSAAGAIGTVAGSLAERLSTGPLVVLSATSLFAVSVLIAPGRGLISRAYRHFAVRRRVLRENFLRDVYEAYEVILAGGPLSDRVSEPKATDDPVVADDALLSQGVPRKLLLERSKASPAHVSRMARRLARDGLIRVVVESGGPVRYALTQKGLAAAWDVVHRHRLWEMFLMHEAELGADHVDRDADDVEHFLTPEIVASLERLLKEHSRRPRLLPSAHPL